MYSPMKNGKPGYSIRTERTTGVFRRVTDYYEHLHLTRWILATILFGSLYLSLFIAGPATQKRIFTATFNTGEGVRVGVKIFNTVVRGQSYIQGRGNRIWCT